MFGGPLGLTIHGNRAWVVGSDSGELIGVDLTPGRADFGRVDYTYQLEPGGTHVIVAGDCVLVAGVGSSISVVEPASSQLKTIPTGQLESIVAGDDGVVWAVDHIGSVIAVDVASATTGPRVPITFHPNEHIEGVWAADALWVGSDTSVVNRVQYPGDPTVTGTLDVGGGIPLAYRDGLIWGARPDELWAIDPQTGEVARHVPLTGLAEILALDVSGDEAWIAARKPGRVGVVERLDLADGRVADEYPVSLPAAVVIAGDRAWVTSYETNELVGLPRP